MRVRISVRMRVITDPPRIPQNSIPTCCQLRGGAASPEAVGDPGRRVQTHTYNRKGGSTGCGGEGWSARQCSGSEPKT